MFGSHMLEVGIGLALLFLFVSLLCTAAREMLEALMKTRALDLERGIRELLDDPDGLGLAKSLYDHPMIYALFAGDYDPSKIKKGRTLAGGDGRYMPHAAREHLPSYIPAGHFATAVLDLVARGEAVTQPFAAAARTVLAPGAALSLEAIRAAAEDLPNARLRRAVLTAVDHAGGDLARAKANLEAWFDGTMDRVSGWSKRRTQVILFLLGLAAAVVFNIDALTVAQRLDRDAPLRDAWVAKAERVSGAGLPSRQALTLKELEGQIVDLAPPIGWSPAPQRIGCESGPTCLGLTSAAKPPDAVGIDPWRLLMAGLGWLITALAVTLGAPFWFDLLNKFMVIRSTVKPSEKSPDEGSEDRGLRSGTGGAGAGPHPTAATAEPDGDGSALARAEGDRAAGVVTNPIMVPGFTPHSWAAGNDSQEGDL